MEIHRLQYPDRIHIEDGQEYSLAIGFFDGLHLGHQQVIRTAKQKAEELQIRTAVMTFNPHPSHLFRKERVGYITSHEEKLRVLESIGVDVLFIVQFDWELAKLSPEQFVAQFIKGLHIKHVTAGFDFTFGAKGAGTMEDMKQLSDGEYGVTIVEKVNFNGEKISSTRIRQLLQIGDVEQTAKLLGRPFRTIGTVVDGDKRGRLLGFPTANIETEENVIIPANGVYAVHFTIDGEVYNGVCNIGVKPTFHHPSIRKATAEVHVLDFDGDLYGKRASIDWLYRIRAERKFDSIEALTAQISKDKETARNLLER